MSKIITYDLCAPGRNYDSLIEAIKTIGPWGRVTESTWIVVTDQNCVTIRDFLQGHIDANDRLFVADLTGAAAWHNTRCSDDWLKQNL